jgi:hypothetical protein
MEEGTFMSPNQEVRVVSRCRKNAINVEEKVRLIVQIAIKDGVSAIIVELKER